LEEQRKIVKVLDEIRNSILFKGVFVIYG